MPDEDERHDGHRQRDDEAHRHRGEVLGGVAPEGVDGPEQAHRERAVSGPRSSSARRPTSPVSWRTMKVREEVRDELRLAEAADGRVARDRRPQREHDERHRRRQHPHEHLGAVGDGLGEADPEEGGQRPRGRSRRLTRRSPPGRGAGEELAHHLFERRVLDGEVADRQAWRAPGPRQRSPRPCGPAAPLWPASWDTTLPSASEASASSHRRAKRRTTRLSGRIRRTSSSSAPS